MSGFDKTKWNADAKFALKFSKFCIWPLGLWPIEENNAFVWFRFGYCFVSQLWMVGTQLFAAYLGCGDSAATVDYIMMAACAIMALSKIIALYGHKDKARDVTSSALNDFLSIPDDETRKILRPFTKRARTVFYVQVVSSYVSNVLITIGALPFLIPPPSANGTSWMNDTMEMPMRQLPLQTGCMFAHYRDAVYTFFYIYESIMINVCLHGNVGADVYFFTMAMYLCGQIELLKIDLLDVGKKNSLENDDTRDHIVKCIDKHRRLLKLVEKLNQLLSGMLIVQLLLNAGLNLMLGIRIILAVKSGMFASALRPIIAFYVLMLQLFLLSYAGDRLAQHTDSVLDALYDSFWYELPPKYRSDLNFVAMRANKPAYMSAGNVYVMNLENFKNVLKASFSYFSILQVMFDA